jgi:hypothetical protein
MRPSTIVAVVVGVILFFVGLALGIWAFIENSGGKPWFYWVAPLLCIGFGLIMIQLIVQYWTKVGRLEVKGRPRSD